MDYIVSGLIALAGFGFTYFMFKKNAKQQNSIEQLERRNDFFKAHNFFKRSTKKDENTFKNMQATNDKDELLVNFTHCLMPSWKIIDDDSVMYQGDEINAKFIIPCVSELKSIERLFSLEKQEKIILGEIISKLETLDNDLTDDNITPDALKTKFKDLFQLIAESTILETMKEQLSNN